MLDGLLDLVLESRGFVFQRAVLPREEQQQQVEEVDGPEVRAACQPASQPARQQQAVTQERPLSFAQDEDEDGVHAALDDASSLEDGETGMAPLDAPGPTLSRKDELRASAGLLSSTGILESKVDAEEWRAESERVAGMLKIPVAADARDWRSHLDQVRQHLDELVRRLPVTQSSLESLRAQAEAMEDKLAGRERSLNQQFDGLVSEYRELKRQLQEVQASYNARTDEVSQLTNHLGRVTEELEEVKARLDEHGSNMSDSSPVVKVANAIKGLQEEIKLMEIRIGVLSVTTLELAKRADASRAA